MFHKMSFNPQCITTGQMNMIFNARIIWRRLTTWTRTYYLSRYSGLGDAQELFGRIYVEALDFGDMLQIAFGRETSNTFTQLINQFSIILRDLITSHIEGDQEAVAENVNRLYRNADEIAAFMASINPYWKEAEWRDFFRGSVQSLLEEINSFTSGEYQLDIEIIDRVSNLTGDMGEAFAQGLFEYLTAGLQCGLAESGQGQCFTIEQVNAIYDIRTFWFELVSWTRAYMGSRYFGVLDPDEVFARLRQVPADYVNRLIQVFGPSPYADELLYELNIYLDLLSQLITAQIENNQEEIDRITRLLYQNAVNRARLISTINPFYSEEEWRRRLFSNLRDTINESITFLTKDFARNLDIYNTLLALAESASDYFAQGIINYINANRNVPEQE